jgi:hypothetical protein
MDVGLGTCPTCGGWAKSAMRDAVSGATGYRCEKGHTWTPGAEPLVAARPTPSVHDFELVETTAYLTGPIADSPFRDFVEYAQRLQSFGLKVVSVHNELPIADLQRDYGPGMAWCSTPEFRHYLLRDLRVVAHADLVVLLPGWEGSLTVTAVVGFARACGIQVISVAELLDLLRGERV